MVSVLQSREQALLASAARTDDPVLRARILLRRARSPGKLPMMIDFGPGGNSAEYLLGSGWSAVVDVDGRWTVGPIAQLLLVTGTRLTESVTLDLEISSVFLVDRHPQQSFEMAVNDEVQLRVRAEFGRPFETRWRVPVPADVVRRLGGLLITIRAFTPGQPWGLGLNEDTRHLGLKMRRLRVVSTA